MNKRLWRLAAVSGLLVVMSACAPSPEPISVEVDRFLAGYTSEFVRLYTESSEAEWASNTHIVEGDESNLERVEAANQAFALYTGSAEVIELAREYLKRSEELTTVQARQLEAVLYRAANNPQTIQEDVNRRITAEAKQTEALFGFDFKLDGASMS